MDPVTIIADITGFMIYFVPGYIFWTFYNFTAVRPRESTPEYLIIKSIATSYVLNISLQQVELATRCPCLKQYHSIILIFISVIMGALLGALRQSNKLVTICKSYFKRGFEDDLLFELWRDAKKNGVVCIRLRNQETKQIITGQLTRVQEYYKEEPVITLAFYQIWLDDEKMLIENFEHVEGIEISIRYTASWTIETMKNIEKREDKP